MIPVSSEWLKLGFEELVERVKSRGPEGIVAAEDAKRYITNARCSPCARRGAEARLRMWLQQRTHGGAA